MISILADATGQLTGKRRTKARGVDQAAWGRPMWSSTAGFIRQSSGSPQWATSARIISGFVHGHGSSARNLWARLEIKFARKNQFPAQQTKFTNLSCANSKAISLTQAKEVPHEPRSNRCIRLSPGFVAGPWQIAIILGKQFSITSADLIRKASAPITAFRLTPQSADSRPMFVGSIKPHHRRPHTRSQCEMRLRRWMRIRCNRPRQSQAQVNSIFWTHTSRPTMPGGIFRSGSKASGGDRAEKTDRKSTRLNSSHPSISYAVFCLKKKKK